MIFCFKIARFPFHTFLTANFYRFRCLLAMFHTKIMLVLYGMGLFFYSTIYGSGRTGWQCANRVAIYRVCEHSCNIECANRVAVCEQGGNIEHEQGGNIVCDRVAI